MSHVRFSITLRKTVIPTKVGIHIFQVVVDSRLRGNDAKLNGIDPT